MASVWILTGPRGVPLQAFAVEADATAAHGLIKQAGGKAQLVEVPLHGGAPRLADRGTPVVAREACQHDWLDHGGVTACAKCGARA